MNPQEVPLLLLFLLMLRHATLITCIRPLRGLLGVSGTMVVSFSLSLWLYPENILEEDTSRVEDLSLSLLILKELVLGLSIGLPCSLLFEIIPFTGRMIDTFRGSQFAEQIAPELGPRDSLLESYGGYLTLWFFFSGVYAREWILLLLKLEESFPVLHGIKEQEYSFLYHRSSLESFLGDFFSTSLLVVIPLVILSLSFELVLSVLQKLNSKFNIGFELSLLRAGAGVFFLSYLLYSGTQGPLMLHRITMSGLTMLQSFIGCA